MAKWIVSLGVVFVCLLLPSAASAAEDAWTQPARYGFEYRVDFPALTGVEADHLRVWIPYPAQTDHQKVLSADIDSPWPYKIHTDGFGNRVVYLEGRGVPNKPLVMRFTVERWPSDGVRLNEIRADTPLDPKRYLHADKLIPLGGLIKQVAEQQSRGHKTEAEKIRAFYDYVVKTMRYNKDGTGWGRGDAVWACTNKRGNCTDFHSLFIGMARSENIPARFFIGFPIPDAASGEIPGYHCWAEYYDRTRGWVPIDASEANKSGQTDAYFGRLPNDRIQLTNGRDLTLVPPQQGAPLNYFIFPYAEADGKPLAKIPARFHFERLPITSAPERFRSDGSVGSDRSVREGGG